MQKTSTDKGLAIARIISAFSMFPMVLDPLKYCWVMIIPSFVMIYFSYKKYKEEKEMGIIDSKYLWITILSSVAVTVLTAATIAYWLDYC